MTFRVGQKVVCVDVSSFLTGKPDKEIDLVKGRVYTVREIGLTSWMDGSSECIRVEEIKVRRKDGSDTPFFARRFRPVVERKTDISIFTAMLNTSKRGVDA